MNAPLGSEAEQSSAAATKNIKLRLIAKNISVQKGKVTWRFGVAFGPKLGQKKSLVDSESESESESESAGGWSDGRTPERLATASQ